MNKEKFWNIIDISLLASRGDFIFFRDKIIQELVEFNSEDIVAFEIILRELIIQADDYRLIAAYRIIIGMISDDSYLYFRCWLIGQGEDSYQQTLKNPDYLASIIDEKSNLNLSFEDLLYVATDAYKKKVGKTTEDNTFPREVAYNKGLIYDHGAPPTKGERCSEDEWPNIFLNLWRKFGW